MAMCPGSGMVARNRRLAAFAIITLMGAPLQRVCAGEGSAQVAVGVRFSQNENAANLVFDLSRSVDASTSALASPDRIVVDMPEVSFQLDPLVGQDRRITQRLCREGLPIRTACSR